MTNEDVANFFHHDTEEEATGYASHDNVGSDGLKKKVQMNLGHVGEVVTFVKLIDTDVSKSNEGEVQTVRDALESLLSAETFQWVLENPGRQDLPGQTASSIDDKGEAKALLTGSFQPLPVEESYECLKECEWNRHITPTLSDASIAIMLLGRCEREHMLDPLSRLSTGRPTDVEVGLPAAATMQLHANAIRNVLRQVHPNITLAPPAFTLLQHLLLSTFERLTEQALVLSRNSRYSNKEKKTISSREIQTAVRLILPGELSKHAVSEGTKAVTKFHWSGW